MPRIRCHYVDCVFLDEGYCAAAAIELDPDDGCMTYSPSGEVSPEEAWEDNEALEEEWEGEGFSSIGEEEWDEEEEGDEEDIEEADDG